MNRLIFLLIAIFLSQSNFSQDSEQNLYKTNSGFVKFVSDAPLEIISAESNLLRGLVDPDERTFAFRLEVKTLKGFNSPLQQEHFYENYMETDDYPNATFSGKIIEDLDETNTGWQSIRAKGTLEIHGISQERIIKCDLRFNGSELEVKSVFTVLLSDHNITIPKLVYQKIAEEINVKIEARMTYQKGAGKL